MKPGLSADHLNPQWTRPRLLSSDVSRLVYRGRVDFSVCRP